jgi:hypothetical protein
MFMDATTHSYPEHVKAKFSENTFLTREPRQQKSPYSASVLQYGSWTFPDLLVKILCVNTRQFLCNTQFYFAVSLLWVDNPYYRTVHDVLWDSWVSKNMWHHELMSICLMHSYFVIFTSAMVASPPPHKFFNVRLFGKFHFVRATQRTGTNQAIIICKHCHTKEKNNRSSSMRQTKLYILNA